MLSETCVAAANHCTNNKTKRACKDEPEQRALIGVRRHNHWAKEPNAKTNRANDKSSGHRYPNAHPALGDMATQYEPPAENGKSRCTCPRDCSENLRPFPQLI